jgi:hypothetical protein
MYLGVALVIYIGAFIWMKMKSPLAVKRDGAVSESELGFKPLEKDTALSEGVLRFRTFMGVGGKSIEWLYPLGLFLGFTGTAVVVLLRTGGGAGFFQHVVQDAALVGFMVFGFYFLRNFYYPFIALVVALVYGGLNFLVFSLIRYSMVLDFVMEFVFVFVFIVATIWLLDHMRNPWIALGLGCFLALTVMSIAFLVYMLIEIPDFDVVKNWLLNTHWFWRVLHCVVIAGIMFGFYKTLNLNIDPSTPGKD